jgi:hypothetical protein
MLAYTPDNIGFDDGGGMLLLALGTCDERRP